MNKNQELLKLISTELSFSDDVNYGSTLKVSDIKHKHIFYQAEVRWSDSEFWKRRQ